MPKEKSIYSKDKDVLVHLRLTKNQYDFIVATAAEFNMKNSEFLRYLITIAQRDFEQNKADERL